MMLARQRRGGPTGWPAVVAATCVSTTFNPPQRRKSDRVPGFVPPSTKRPRAARSVTPTEDRQRRVAAGCVSHFRRNCGLGCVGWLAGRGQPIWQRTTTNPRALPSPRTHPRTTGSTGRFSGGFPWRCRRPRRPRGSGVHHWCGSQPGRREGGRRQPWSGRVEGPPSPQSRKEPETRHIEPRVHPTSTGRTRNVRLCASSAPAMRSTSRGRAAPGGARIKNARLIPGRQADWSMSAVGWPCGQQTMEQQEPPRRSAARHPTEARELRQRAQASARDSEIGAPRPMPPCPRKASALALTFCRVEVSSTGCDRWDAPRGPPSGRTRGPARWRPSAIAGAGSRRSRRAPATARPSPHRHRGSGARPGAGGRHLWWHQPYRG
jgi:hypothetical protein